MKCDNCKEEQQWLEVIGQQFICKKCVRSHKIMGLIHRTHIDTFQFLLRRLKPQNFEEFKAISREQIEELVNLRKMGIKLPTTNVVNIV